MKYPPKFRISTKTNVLYVKAGNAYHYLALNEMNLTMLIMLIRNVEMEMLKWKTSHREQSDSSLKVTNNDSLVRRMFTLFSNHHLTKQKQHCCHLNSIVILQWTSS